ncbi:hypothetical protein RTG_00053 [Rhodotorula toruloides ATCC 204091]|uniref:At2g23090 like protein n=1 Tax=Rhodotorula toruloides TaxID=5286 RepID=A0A2T0AEI3_RHOTO|nr:hypothetical protein RTG_00053 [Rhodotorula toruloides ATCC 204091]PRQ76408.1 At2g23090 like protein [Rhodotorula toruloides]
MSSSSHFVVQGESRGVRSTNEWRSEASDRLYEKRQDEFSPSAALPTPPLPPRSHFLPGHLTRRHSRLRACEAREGNGAKAQQKRERNAKDAKKGPTSQLANNKAAMNLKCKICMQLFMNTSRAPQLKEHAENKHSKDIKDCFPDFQG